MGRIRLEQKERGEDDIDSMISNFKISNGKDIIKLAMKMHTNLEKVIKDYSSDTKHQLKLTPVTFTNLIQTFKEIFKKRGAYYTSLKRKFEIGLSKLLEAELKIIEV